MKNKINNGILKILSKFGRFKKVKKFKKSNLGRASRIYLLPHIPMILLTTFLAALVGAFPLAIVKMTEYLVNDVLIARKMDMLFLVTVGMVAISIVKGFMVYYRNVLSSYVSGKIVMELRLDLYKKIQSLSYDYFSESKTGDLMSRFAVDTEKTLGILLKIFSVLSEMISVVALVVILFVKDWSLSLICMVVLPLVSNVIKKYAKRLRKTGKDIQESYGKLTTILQEGIGGIRVIKAFASEEYEIEKYKIENENNFKHGIRNRKLDARVKPLVEAINTATMALVALYGGFLVINGRFTPGDLMAFLTALGLAYDPLKRLTDAYSFFQTSLPALDRLYEILDTKGSVEDAEDAVEFDKPVGKVKFEDVMFSYDNDENVIKNFNLDVKAGEMIALVGRSGSGKSTLVNLIPRFYDVNKGKIEIDDINVKNYKLKSLRTKIGIVPQDTFLFSGTIYENILYGKRDATEEEVIAASKMANAYRFIEKLPKGFDTEVGERGVLLSGGQKQRIAIARAILENPPIMILDEATSALDTESERLVQDALDNLMTNRTTFVIAHRLSTILHADKIVVMEEGEIKEAGRHEELLRMDGIYKKLYETQFGKIENY